MKRSGFAMVEIVIGIFILTLLATSAIIGMSSMNEATRFQKELNFYRDFDNGLKTTFESITDTFEPYCSSITTGTQASWGWGHSSCNATSPLPVFSSAGTGDQIIYSIQWSTLSAQEQTTLEQSIVQSYAPYCQEVSKGASSLTLRCGNLTGLTYDLGAGAVASAHTAGSDINPLVVPSFTISYRQQNARSNQVNIVTYNGTFADLWQKRRNYSLEKFNTFSRSMKAFFNAKLIRESQNTAPTGLNSVDDEFVPWHWEALGGTPASVSSAVCTDTAGTCTNLTSPAIWQTTTPHRATVMKNVIANVSATNAAISLDGFGNMVRMLPISSLCTNTDLSVCTDTALPSAPSVPADNYYAGAIKPPYASVLFTASCKDTSVTRPNYCRNYIAY
ncbi:MAG: type II secretion system protein [Paludibacter sp.]|nr:type II secretion system protein [Paludibacter sp.]